jgi:hypothetical protein
MIALTSSRAGVRSRGVVWVGQQGERAVPIRPRRDDNFFQEFAGIHLQSNSHYLTLNYQTFCPHASQKGQILASHISKKSGINP